MTPSWITIFVPLFAVSVSVWGQNCYPQRLVQCQNLLSEKFQAESFLVAETREDLKNFCRQLNGLMTCVESFMDDCMRNHKDHQLIMKLLSGSRAFEDEMCRVDSTLAEEYLRHAPCLVGATPKVKHCYEKIKPSQMESHFSDGQSQQDVLKSICCIAKSMIGCFLTGYERECGAESVPPARRSLELIFQPVEAIMCITVDTSHCSSNDVRYDVTVALVTSAAALWPWWCRC